MARDVRYFLSARLYGWMASVVVSTSIPNTGICQTINVIDTQNEDASPLAGGAWGAGLPCIIISLGAPRAVILSRPAALSCSLAIASSAEDLIL